LIARIKHRRLAKIAVPILGAALVTGMVTPASAAPVHPWMDAAKPAAERTELLLDPADRYLAL
jgi:hypothetical protein